MKKKAGIDSVKRFGIEVQDNGQVLVVIEYKSGKSAREILSAKEVTVLMAAIESGVSPYIKVRSSLARLNSLLESEIL